MRKSDTTARYKASKPLFFPDPQSNDDLRPASSGRENVPTPAHIIRPVTNFQPDLCEGRRITDYGRKELPQGTDQWPISNLIPKMDP